MHRRTLHAAAVLGVTAPLAACSGSSTGSGSSPALRVAWWGNNVRNEATQKVLAGFTAANPGITAAGETSEFAAYFDKLATQTAGNDAPDVFALGGRTRPSTPVAARCSTSPRSRTSWTWRRSWTPVRCRTGR